MADKAVILAAGGFGSDIVFRSSQDPRLTEKIDTTNQPSATSESLKAALRIGSCPRPSFTYSARTMGIS